MRSENFKNYNYKKWTAVVNRRPRTVLISFGSVARSVQMPAMMKNAIVELVRRLPDTTFIWKYEEPEDAVGKGVDNLLKVDWMPQNDLLRKHFLHENLADSGRISAFVTHAGMGSSLEAAMASVPLILTGILGDQVRNAAVLASHGLGVVLEKRQLEDVDFLEATLQRVIGDPRFSLLRIDRIQLRRKRKKACCSYSSTAVFTSRTGQSVHGLRRGSRPCEDTRAGLCEDAALEDPFS